MSYDAYGRSRHHWAADITGDGAVNTADQTAMSTAHRKSIGHADYNVDADVTRTGTVNNDDLEWTVIANFDGALPDGALSAHGNTVGYAGYIFNAEVPGGGVYTVRFRHYDPALGRWLERDPLGYVDGLNLYEYVMGNSVNALDPFGLCSDDMELEGEIRDAIEKLTALYVEETLRLIGSEHLYRIIGIIVYRVNGRIEVRIQIINADGKLIVIKSVTTELDIEILRAVGVVEDELNDLRSKLKAISFSFTLIDGLSKAINSKSNLRAIMEKLFDLLGEKNPQFQRQIAIELVDIMKASMPASKYEDLAAWLAIYGWILGSDQWYNPLFNMDPQTKRSLRKAIGIIRDELR